MAVRHMTAPSLSETFARTGGRFVADRRTVAVELADTLSDVVALHANDPRVADLLASRPLVRHLLRSVLDGERLAEERMTDANPNLKQDGWLVLDRL